jgi:excinuclease UvrABC nuclease subunit
VRTPSQLDAALIERRLVDRHAPAFNPAAHRSRAAYLIKVDTGSAFPALRVVEAPRQRGTLIGPFTSRWTALNLVERLTDEYGLRRCARRLGPRLALKPCDARDAGDCPAPCVTPIDRTDYARRLARSLAVFDDASEFRARLEARQAAAASSGRYEAAIRYRDGLRALERALSARGALREAVTHDAIFVEEHDGDFVVSFIRGGLRAAVLRGDRTRIAPKLPETLRRVFFDSTPPVDLLRLGPEKVGEVLAIASFAAEGVYLEVAVADQARTLSRLRMAMGVDRRLPRRRHGVVSDV